MVENFVVKMFESILSSKYNDRSSKDERKEDILIMSLLNFWI